MDSRMDLRLKAEDKTLIERAASLLGIKAATFSRSVLIREAGEVIQGAHVVKFDEVAARDCLAALSQPFTPNEALARALQRGTELDL
jgi:uncharacterized protein (DUF1778 family)